MKSLYSIQKTPSLLPWAISSWRRFWGQSVHSSDQLPFHEKRPHGFRSRNNLEAKDPVSDGRAVDCLFILTTHFIFTAPPHSEEHRIGITPSIPKRRGGECASRLWRGTPGRFRPRPNLPLRLFYGSKLKCLCGIYSFPQGSDEDPCIVLYDTSTKGPLVNQTEFVFILVSISNISLDNIRGIS